MLSPVFSLRTVHLDARHSLSATYFADQQEEEEEEEEDHSQEELMVWVRVAVRRSFNLFPGLEQLQHLLYRNDDTFDTTDSVVEHWFAMGDNEQHLELMAQQFDAFPMVPAGKTVAYRSYCEVVTNEIQKAWRRGFTTLDLLVEIDYQIDILELTPALRERYQDEYRASWLTMRSLEAQRESAAMEEDDFENTPEPSTSVFSEYLERFLWKDDVHGDRADDEQCVVCLEHFVPNQSEVACMPCKHVFHDVCITKWLELNPSCPICRFVPCRYVQY